MIWIRNWQSAYHLGFFGALRLWVCFYWEFLSHYINHSVFLQVIVTAVHTLSIKFCFWYLSWVTFFPCFFSIDQHLNILVLADLLAVLLMRTLQLVERTVQHLDSLQIPDWQRGESGHNDIEITWAGHIYILLQTYQKAMVWQLAEEK